MSKPPLDRLYRQMVRMRLFEEALAELWEEGLISGELHLGIGEEAIVAGVVDHLVPGDALALDHRPTPALVGRGVNLTAMALEMVGSEDGLCRGRGGHMHLFDPELLSASSGIVGAAAPLACGFALAHQHLRPDGVSVAFFGESALNQGMTMEALNLAAVWRLPVVFVIKDNGWAITTRSADMTGGSIERRVRGFGLPVTKLDGTDVTAVWRTAGRAIRSARRRRGPAAIHATCYRPRGHFEHDPLVRMVTEPSSTRDDAAGMIRAATDGTTPLGSRLAGLARVSRTVGRVAAQRVLHRRDPLRKAARSIDRDQAAATREAVADEIGVALRVARTAARGEP